MKIKVTNVSDMTADEVRRVGEINLAKLLKMKKLGYSKEKCYNTLAKIFVDKNWRINEKPVLMDQDNDSVITKEYWYNGRFIHKQNHPKLPPYCSFDATDDGENKEPHYSFKEALEYCKLNPCITPQYLPEDF